MSENFFGKTNLNYNVLQLNLVTLYQPDHAGIPTPERNYMRGFDPLFFLRPGVEYWTI